LPSPHDGVTSANGPAADGPGYRTHPDGPVRALVLTPRTAGVPLRRCRAGGRESAGGGPGRTKLTRCTFFALIEDAQHAVLVNGYHVLDLPGEGSR
jgi:hypothetical protein